MFDAPTIRIKVEHDGMNNVSFVWSPHPSKWCLRGLTHEQLDADMQEVFARDVYNRPCVLNVGDFERPPSSAVTLRDIAELAASVLRKHIMEGRICAGGVEVVNV